MKKVLMFAGQGSQFAGMGESLFEEFSDVHKEANEILGYDVKTVCLGLDEEKNLDRTLYTQPCLYTTNNLLYKKWLQTHDEDDISFLMGHSLGEYNALLTSGAFEFGEGLRMVNKRAQLMDKAKGGKMAAVIGMDREILSSILEENGGRVEIANINTKEQVVLSGMEADILELVDVLEKKGAKKVVILSVSGAFHSRYMRDAREEFTEYLKGISFRRMTRKVISNKEAREYGEDVQTTLARQIDSPVRWVESIQYVRSFGEFDYEEIAPRGVLKAFLRRI